MPEFKHTSTVTWNRWHLYARYFMQISLSDRFMLPCPNNPQNITRYVRWLFFFRLESVNPSQIRMLEPFVIVVMKPWKVAHSSCSSPLSCCQGGSRALSKVCFPTKWHLSVAKLPLKSSSRSMLSESLTYVSYHYADQCASYNGLQCFTFSGAKLHEKENIPGCCCCSGL